MKIINARKFNEINDWFEDDTPQEMVEYQENKENNFEAYDAEAFEEELPILKIDEEDDSAESYLVDNYVPIEEPVSVIDDSLQEVEDFRRMQKDLPEEDILEEEPLIKKREEVEEEDVVDESVAEETEPDDRVQEFATAREAVEAAKDENRVLEIFYVTRGRGGRDEKHYLKRERGLPRTDTGGVHIHRIVEPHYIYTAGNGNEIVITYDRSVRRIRSFVINNIYDYNFTKNRKTKEDQYFKPRMRVMPSSKKGIKTMKTINDKLTKISSTLEDKGLKKTSLVVKDAIKAVHNYKMAQYVGIQGYWLKNRRCWDNCYRHKRTSQPGTPAQEVWMECWDEYKESINNEKSTWGKYAGVDDSLKIGSKKERKWGSMFANKVEAKVKEGLNRPEAIYSVIESEAQAYSSKIIQASSDLMALADTLVNNGHKDIGKEMAEISIEILKEADFQGQQQNWVGRGVDKVKNFFRGFRGRNDASDVVAKIQDVVKRVNELIDMLDNPGQYVKRNPKTDKIKQTFQLNGFIIEAGKGMKIVEAYNKCDIIPNVPWSNPGYVDQQQFKEWAAKNPGYENTKPYKLWASENPTQVPTIPYVNQSNLAPGQYYQDTTGKGGYDVQGQPTQPQSPDPAPSSEKVRIEGLNTKHRALMEDVKSLVGEFTGLLRSPDPQVSQHVRRAVPLLQSFLDTTSQLRSMDKDDRNASFRKSLSQLARDLQGVLGGQVPVGENIPPTQLGNPQTTPLGNPQTTEQIGQPPVQNNNQQGSQSTAKIIEIMKRYPNFAKAFVEGKAEQSHIEWLINNFVDNGVPVNMENLNKFKKDLEEARIK